MPRDSNSNYSLPIGYLAVTGEPILASQHNPPLEDLAAAMTGSLARNGSGGMAGPLKLADGDTSAPSLAFNSAPANGFMKIAGGLAIVIGGQVIAEFTADGFIGLPIGTPVHVLDDTLPPRCIWADGRNVSRTTYAALFAKWADKYGAGDGSTTFGMPDLRGTGFIGRDNIGGTDANRLASVPTVSGDRLTTGSIIGAALHTLTQPQLPAVAPTGTVTAPINNITAVTAIGSVGVAPGAGSASAGPVTSSIPVTYNSGPTFTGNALGSGAAHNNVQRSLVCNFAIYAGA